MAKFHLCAPEVVYPYQLSPHLQFSRSCINALQDSYLVKAIRVSYPPLEFQCIFLGLEFRKYSMPNISTSKMRFFFFILQKQLMYLFLERYVINFPTNVCSHIIGTALNKNMMNFDLYLKQNMCNTNLIITLLPTTIN